MNKKLLDMVHGKVRSVFFYYTVPWVLGMVAFSSAVIIDGLFLGKYVGSEALGAANFVFPILSLLIGMGIMISVGGSVRCGKYLGQGDIQAA